MIPTWSSNPTAIGLSATSTDSASGSSGMVRSPDELRRRCSRGAEVEYVGEASPYFVENDGLYFVVRPMTKKGKPSRRGVDPRLGQRVLSAGIRSVTCHDKCHYQAS